MAEIPAPSLAEYDGNPFIARLPPPASQRTLHSQLNAPPLFDEKERTYPPHLRKHCIARLAHCFLPQARQIDLADRFGLLLRQGYLGRNPLSHDYLHHLHAGLDRIQAGSLDGAKVVPASNTAACFALLGCPGVGKTIAVNRVLAMYPQCIVHEEPFSLVQITWLRLEAPALGSLKQLCIDFFAAIDRLIGTDYVKRYATGVTTEQMVVHMAHVAHLHALGVLVIDEIQHLKGVRLGGDALMKFLVKLVNTIGVPVILIGTLGALPILQGSFSQARRATGLGSLLWDRMAKDATWEHFVRTLWPFQWTNPPTPLTPELSDVLYDESQGVADLAMKLYLLAQLRLVATREVRKGQSEQLTERLFRQVAREEFAMVRPMVNALRQNDRQKLAAFDDLRSLDAHVRAMLGTAAVAATGPEGPAPQPQAATPLETPVASPESMLIKALVDLGVAPDVANVHVKRCIATHPEADILQLMGHLSAAWVAQPPKRAKRAPAESPETWEADDLRRLVQAGTQAGKSAYASLLDAGVVRPPLLDYAA